MIFVCYGAKAPVAKLPPGCIPYFYYYLVMPDSNRNKTTKYDFKGVMLERRHKSGPNILKNNKK